MYLNKTKAKEKAIFLKIAPDSKWSQIDEVIEVVQESGITLIEPIQLLIELVFKQILK